jgi:hypothetical protein
MALSDNITVSRPAGGPQGSAVSGWRVAGYVAMALAVLVIGMPVYQGKRESPAPWGGW